MFKKGVAPEWLWARGPSSCLLNLCKFNSAALAASLTFTKGLIQPTKNSQLFALQI